VGVADHDITLHFKDLAFPANLEWSGLQLEWGGRPETVTELQPGQGETEKEKQK
jgi:hypothetical protein